MLANITSIGKAFSPSFVGRLSEARDKYIARSDSDEYNNGIVLEFSGRKEKIGICEQFHKNI